MIQSNFTFLPRKYDQRSQQEGFRWVLIHEGEFLLTMDLKKKKKIRFMLLSKSNVLTLLEFLFVCHQLFKIFHQKNIVVLRRKR